MWHLDVLVAIELSIAVHVATTGKELALIIWIVAPLIVKNLFDYAGYMDRVLGEGAQTNMADGENKRAPDNDGGLSAQDDRVAVAAGRKRIDGVKKRKSVKSDENFGSSSKVKHLPKSVKSDSTISKSDSIVIHIDHDVHPSKNDKAEPSRGGVTREDHVAGVKDESDINSIFELVKIGKSRKVGSWMN